MTVSPPPPSGDYYTIDIMSHDPHGNYKPEQTVTSNSNGVASWETSFPNEIGSWEIILTHPLETLGGLVYGTSTNT